MSNETDLDWLARNVHVWHPLRDLAVVQHADVDIYVTWPSVCSEGITKDQWLSRRAELQNKPSWSKAEEWAEWLAQDSYGCWGFFQKKPLMHALSWIAINGYYSINSPGAEVLGDWRDTLEKRPEQFKPSIEEANRLAQEFNPFTSIEDNQDQKMKRDDGWFERGDLPPVGIAVQLWHGGTYAYDCELISKRGNNFVLWNLTWDRPDSADCMMCVFKPIPTERDVLIEIIKKTDDTDDKIADAILAAGFKRGAA